MKGGKVYQEIRKRENSDDINRPSGYLDHCCPTEVSAVMYMIHVCHPITVVTAHMWLLSTDRKN